MVFDYFQFTYLWSDLQNKNLQHLRYIQQIHEI